jgi:hypothetical protein
MFDLVAAIHKALRIESTWAFVLLIASGTGVGAGVMGGFFAWIIDTAYKKTPDYIIEHSPKARSLHGSNWTVADQLSQLIPVAALMGRLAGVGFCPRAVRAATMTNTSES